MNIDDLTISEARSLMALFSGGRIDNAGPWVIGRGYLIRCVTHYQIGRLESVSEHELELSDAGWCADTGCFTVALSSGVVEEYEPAPDGAAIVGRGAIIDAYVWSHDLPCAAK